MKKLETSTSARKKLHLGLLQHLAARQGPEVTWHFEQVLGQSLEKNLAGESSLILQLIGEQ